MRSCWGRRVNQDTLRKIPPLVAKELIITSIQIIISGYPKPLVARGAAPPVSSFYCRMTLRCLWGGRRREGCLVFLLPVIGCTKSGHLQVPHGFRQGRTVRAFVVQSGPPGSTSVTEGPRAALRTFSPVAKLGGSQIVGPHPSDLQTELVDMSRLSSAVLRGGTCGCCTPVPLIGCDGGSGSISTRPRYDSTLSGDA